MQNNLIYAGRRDRAAYSEAVETSPRIQNILDQAAKTDDHAIMEQMTNNTFQLLYQRNPLWRETTQPTIQEHILREISQSKEFRELTAYTQGDIISSAMACGEFGEGIYKRVSSDPAVNEFLNDEYKVNKGIEDSQNVIEAIEGMDPQAQQKPELQEALAKAKSDLASLQEQAKAMAGDGREEMCQDFISEIRRELRGKAEQVKKDIVELNEAETMLGTAPSSIEAKLKLKETLFKNNRLKELIALAGRMRRTAIKKRYAEVKDFREEVIGVKSGDELDKLVPSEYALLTFPVGRDLFLQKFADKQLMLYDHTGKDREGSGPIIMLVDSTGSMEGKKELWSKAVFMGYMAVAEQENRDLHLVQFGGPGNVWHRSFLYKTKPKSVTRDHTLEAVNYFMRAGSTCLVTPLKESLEILKDPNWKKADVVMVTDAEVNYLDPDFVQEFNKAKEELRFTAYGVLIGSPSYKPTLDLVMDKSICVDDLKNDDAITTFLYAS